MKARAAQLADEIRARLLALRVRNAPNLRGIRRELSARLRREPGELVLAIAYCLIEPAPGFNSRFMAYELINKHSAALASLNERDLKRLGRGLDSWGAVDTFACYLAGPAWREGQVSDSLIHKWAKSKDRWRRRAALVSTVPLNRKALGGRGDTRRTLGVCVLLMNDRDDMVVKALSWALRDLSKCDPPSVERFLTDHNDRLAPLVTREVRNKLKTGLKNPKRNEPREALVHRCSSW